jgi:hypothetical protein
MEIFLGLCQKIGVFLDYDWTALTEELRHKLGTTKEEIMLERWHQKLAEVEKESGRDHKHFLGLCGLLAVAYFVPEMLVPARERKWLTSQDLESKLEEGRKLLEWLLKQRLDDETVTKLLDAFSFDNLLSPDDDRTEGVLEKLVLESARQPSLTIAFDVLSTYYGLRSRYVFIAQLATEIGESIENGRLSEFVENIEIFRQMGWIITTEVSYQIILGVNITQLSWYSSKMAQKRFMSQKRRTGRSTRKMKDCSRHFYG